MKRDTASRNATWFPRALFAVTGVFPLSRPLEPHYHFHSLGFMLRTYTRVRDFVRQEEVEGDFGDLALHNEKVGVVNVKLYTLKEALDKLLL